MGYFNDLNGFRAATKDGDVDRAWHLALQIAREYPESPLSLGDARGLVVLLGRTGDPRFEAAANRWLERIRPNHTEAEMQIAKLAIDGLKGSKLQAHRCERVLLALFSFPGPGTTKKPPP